MTLAAENPSRTVASDASPSIIRSSSRDVVLDRVVRIALITCSLVAVLTTIGIVASLLFESLRFFQRVPVTEFLFGLQWSPQTALRADQVGSSGAFGAVPLITGTLLISAIALIVAAPLGLLSAVYLAEYASDKARSIIKPLIEL
ncbi:MAG: phosphate ABC transporter permease subunit PstC, partial [Planctomycetota bacterium]